MNGNQETNNNVSEKVRKTNPYRTLEYRRLCNALLWIEKAQNHDKSDEMEQAHEIVCKRIDEYYKRNGVY